jgi:prepilin-type N-terminal cleavage/methylation domain-containing protein
MRHRLGTRGRQRRPAFTLVELLIVMSIMTLLAGLALGATALLRQRSHRDSALVLLRRIETALEQYRDTFGDWSLPIGPIGATRDATVYPRLANILLGAEAVRPSEVRSGVGVVDIWGNRINAIYGGFNSPGLDIWSNGPDGQDNRDPNNPKVYGDDVVNWAGR